MSAVDTVRYRIHFVEKDYSISDAVHFLLDSNPKFLMPPYTSTKKGPQLVLEEDYGDILPAEGDGTEVRAVP